MASDEQYPRDFIGACGYFSQQVAHIHGSAQLEYKQSRNKKRGVYAVDTRGGRGSQAQGHFGRGGNQGARGNNAGIGSSDGGAQVINGIDVTDLNRNFTVQEWEALGPNNGRAIVLQMRECASGRGNRDGRGRGRGCGHGGNERNISAAGAEEHAQDEEGTPANNAGGDRGGRNGCGFGHGAYGGGRS
jgi:hypothetical protein